MKKGRRNLRSASQRSNTFLQEKEFILKFHKADENEREVEGKLKNDGRVTCWFNLCFKVLVRSGKRLMK